VHYVDQADAQRYRSLHCFGDVGHGSQVAASSRSDGLVLICLVSVVAGGEPNTGQAKYGP
jgi:hypothetical protein